MTVAKWWKYVRENRAYHGAGLLITRTEPVTGSTEVLLGLRNRWPGKGRWSIPGGEREWDGVQRRYTESFLECARRETEEEFCRGELFTTGRTLWRRLADVLPPDFSPESLPPPWTVWRPYFRWHTYLVRLRARPTGWPVLDTWEFSRSEWWRTDLLPGNTYVYACRALRWFRKKGYLPGT